MARNITGDPQGLKLQIDDYVYSLNSLRTLVKELDEKIIVLKKNNSLEGFNTAIKKIETFRDSMNDVLDNNLAIDQESLNDCLNYLKQLIGLSI